MLENRMLLGVLIVQEWAQNFAKRISLNFNLSLWAVSAPVGAWCLLTLFGGFEFCTIDTSASKGLSCKLAVVFWPDHDWQFCSLQILYLCTWSEEDSAGAMPCACRKRDCLVSRGLTLYLIFDMRRTVETCGMLSLLGHGQSNSANQSNIISSCPPQNWRTYKPLSRVQRHGKEHINLYRSLQEDARRLWGCSPKTYTRTLLTLCWLSLSIDHAWLVKLLRATRRRYPISRDVKCDVHKAWLYWQERERSREYHKYTLKERYCCTGPPSNASTLLTVLSWPEDCSDWTQLVRSKRFWRGPLVSLRLEIHSGVLIWSRCLRL